MSLLPALLLAATLGSAPASSDGMAIGKRFIAALKGKSDFVAADFSKTLKDSDKAALRRFGNACRIEDAVYGLVATRDPDVFLQDTNFVSVRMHCRGATTELPIGLSLHLENGKIRKVETHNADLLRDR